MPASRRRYFRFAEVGRVVTALRLPTRSWSPDWTPRPGQILLLRREQLGRVVVSVSLILHRQAEGGRRWINRGARAGRVIETAARRLITAAAEATARLPAAVKVIYRRLEPVLKAPTASPDLPDLKPAPREAPDVAAREGVAAKPARRRAAPAATTLRSPYSRWDRR